MRTDFKGFKSLFNSHFKWILGVIYILSLVIYAVKFLEIKRFIVFLGYGLRGVSLVGYTKNPVSML